MESLSLSTPYMSRKAVVGLLFVFVISFAISAIYHLPVGWLLSQESVKSQVPVQLRVSQSHGSLWQGSSQLAITSAKRPSQSTRFSNIGQLSWDLSLLSLLMAQIDVDTLWRLENSHISGNIVTALLSEKPLISASKLNGQVDLIQLLKLSNDANLKNIPITGDISLHDFQIEFDPLNPWPSLLQGQLKVNDLQILGTALPIIEITPVLKTSLIDLKLSGKGDGWVLVGGVTVLKNRQYRVNIKVVAQSPSQMPDWSMMMQQQSPMVAVLKSRGRW